MSPSPERPLLFKLGVALLVANSVLVVGICAMGGLLGSLAVLLGSVRTDSPGEVTSVVLVGALFAFVLGTIACFSMLSLGVCAMAWRGSRPWVAGLVGVALVQCIVLIPNPLGILAAVFSVLGALEVLDSGRSPGKIEGGAPPSRPASPPRPRRPSPQAPEN